MSKPKAKTQGSTRKLVLTVLGGLIAVGFLFVVMKPRKMVIEVVQPRLGQIRESFREPARTRLENTWKIAMQVNGRLGRVGLEPGDAVTKGQLLAVCDKLPLENAQNEAKARIERLRAQLVLLDDNSVEEAQLTTAEAQAKSTEDALVAAAARVSAAEARVETTKRDLERIQMLLESGAADEQSVDRAELAATEAAQAFQAAESDLASREGLLSAHRSQAITIRQRIERKSLERKQILASISEGEAQLDSINHDIELADLVSPIDGVVLERYERGEKPLPKGTELLLLGKPEEIEVIADVLTEDALKLKPGDDVALESLAGEVLLRGHVKHVEPQGFTKFSSLGVEQQRVNVLVDIDGPLKNLAVGFRLHARFFTAGRENAILVPRYSVLQAPDKTFYVFVIEEGRLAQRPVTMGLSNDLEMEISEGLAIGDVVVMSPEATFEEGTPAAPLSKR